MLKHMHNSDALSQTQAFEWHQRFREGRSWLVADFVRPSLQFQPRTQWMDSHDAKCRPCGMIIWYVGDALSICMTWALSAK
ncbi:hypothetical protein TNCV_3964661 [Trichonephila clavipes]|nr:hypothetical protein TNCV_3964661 [Trichonephila clavipes]